MSLSQIKSRALLGLSAPSVIVEVHLANGLPSFTLVGLADVEVKEARERVRSAILNAGDEHLNMKNYDSALVYFRESELIFENVDYPTGKAFSLGNLGMVYANFGQSDLAEKNINEAISILEELGNFYPICTYLISMSDIYLEKTLY